MPLHQVDRLTIEVDTVFDRFHTRKHRVLDALRGLGVGHAGLALCRRLFDHHPDLLDSELRCIWLVGRGEYPTTWRDT